MEHLVGAYLQYQMYADEEHHVKPPLCDDSSGVIEIEVVDVFCRSLARLVSKC
jgi:hypothetical protein